MQLTEVLSRECKVADCPGRLRKAESALSQEQNVAAHTRQETQELQHQLRNARGQLRISANSARLSDERYIAEARRLDSFKEAD